MLIMLSLAPKVAPALPPAARCAGCGTTGGARRTSGQFVRYRGERFGLDGMLCATCRAREIRHQNARALGFEPGKVGRRPLANKTRSSTAPPRPSTTRPSLTPEDVAENLRAVREEGERNGLRPRPGTTPMERQQKYWAELADSDRRLVKTSRSDATARGGYPPRSCNSGGPSSSIN